MEQAVSIQAIAWVLEHSRSRGYDRLVLLAIANHADAVGGLAWPSVDKIADEAAMSPRSVYRAIQVLTGLNELEVRPGGGRGNRNTYQLKGLKTLTGSQQTLSETLTDGPETLTEMSINGDTAGNRTVSNRPEPYAHARQKLPDAPLATGLVDRIRREHGWVKPEETPQEDEAVS